MIMPAGCKVGYDTNTTSNIAGRTIWGTQNDLAGDCVTSKGEKNHPTLVLR
jgi:hypothetical protein